MATVINDIDPIMMISRGRSMAKATTPSRLGSRSGASILMPNRIATIPVMVNARYSRLTIGGMRAGLAGGCLIPYTVGPMIFVARSRPPVMMF